MRTITLYRCGRCGALDAFTTLYPSLMRHPVTGVWYLALTCGVCGALSGLPCSDDEATEAAQRVAHEHHSIPTD